MPLKQFIRTYLVETLMFIGLIVVFFYSGLTPNTPKKIDAVTPPKPIETVKQEIKIEPIAPTEQNNSLPPIQNPGAITTNTNNQQVNPNPYAVLMNRQGDSPNNIKDSLGNLRGEAPSTEAIIERNTYFKKLSDQLKDLQGNVNSEEERPNNPPPGPGANQPDNAPGEPIHDEEEIGPEDELDIEE